MKAIINSKYGNAKTMQLLDIQKPIPGDDEVLIKVHAVSINSWDLGMLNGSPIFIRMWGLFKPKVNILGSDVAGEVIQVGKNVDRFKVGDRVYGDLVENNWGGFAQFTCAAQNALTLIPDSLSYIEAAAIPQAACMAYQALELASIKEGQTVLINGAGGGCGSYALQFAKLYGGQVTGVDRTDKLEFMQSIGADHVLDYTKTDYTTQDKKYDIIIDMVVDKSPKGILKALKEQGQFIMVGGKTLRILQMFALSKWYTRRQNKSLRILGAVANYKLKAVGNIIKDHPNLIHIDKTYDLDKVPEAMDYIAGGHVKGKIVIDLDSRGSIDS
ncbi:NAD(P)-dependent alcohol dehydrogenase [Fusibacter sp. JL216-2]|uniref:NAD(P)-dependent alcohol dehydrogenase n=1 Tax=Fusibacter sp. JL216-2 TaxID=3071453 RepID=UPI003D357CB1